MMLEGTYELNICLGAPIPGFPQIEISPENPKVELPPQTGEKKDMEVRKIPHSVTFFRDDDDVMKAIYTTPRGKQKVDKVLYNDYCAAWEVYAGSEGVELFHCVMILSESTNAVWGFTGGVSPLFRGYSPFEGKKVTT
jgi:hypothetical protein